MVAGVSKQASHPLKKASATVSDLISTRGRPMASGQRVNWSTRVSKYLKPSEYGKRPTMSLCTWSKLSVGSVNLAKTGMLWRETLAVWQPLHFWHQFATSLFMPCHMERILMRGFVALLEGWSKPCKPVKTFLRNLGVTYGLICPIDTSHHTRILSKVLINLKSIVLDGECLNCVNSASTAWSAFNSL